MNARKKQAILMIVILIIIIMTVVCVMYVMHKKNKNESLDNNTSIMYDKKREEVYEKMMEEMIMPNGIFQLKSNYKGDNDLEDFYKLLKQLGDYTVVLSNYSDKEIKNKYETINNKLENEYGVTNPEELMDFYRDKKLTEIINATIDINSIKPNSLGLSFDITFDYNDDIKINYSVIIKNKQYSSKFVKFTLAN